MERLITLSKPQLDQVADKITSHLQQTIKLSLTDPNTTFEFTFSDASNSNYLITSSHTNQVFMLIPVACNQQQGRRTYQVFVAIIELDKIADQQMVVQEYVHIHKVQYDRLEANKLKGDLRETTNDLDFEPNVIRIDSKASVMLIYGKKGCLVANIPGKDIMNKG